MPSTSLENPDNESVLQKYAAGRLYLRLLCLNRIDEESTQLENNEKAMKKAKIKTVADLKKYFEKDEKNEIQLLEGFRFRPSTAVKEELPISALSRNGFALLIETEMAAFFYKENAESSQIASGKFFFPRPTPNRVKDLQSRENLFNKLEEMNASRKGERPDNYNKRYGSMNLTNTEVLLTYKWFQVKGIVLLDQVRMEDALAFKKEIENKIRLEGIISKINPRLPLDFFKYDINYGKLSPIRNAKIKSFKKTGLVCIKDKEPFCPIISGDDFRSLYNVSEFKDMTCSLQEHFPPTSEHPVEYNFNVASKANPQNTLKCKAFFESKSGFPFIRVNNKIFHDPFRFFATFANEYQKRQTIIADTLLKNELVKKYLEKNLKVSELSLNLCSETKSYLFLDYKPCALEGLDYKKLLKLIGYPAQCKSKRIIPPDDTSVIRIQLPVVQAIDPMIKTLKSFIETLEPTKSCVVEPLLKKPRR